MRISARRLDELLERADTVDALAERLIDLENRINGLSDLLITAFTAAGRYDLVPQRPPRPRHLRVVRADSAGGAA